MDQLPETVIVGIITTLVRNTIFHPSPLNIKTKMIAIGRFGATSKHNRMIIYDVQHGAGLIWDGFDPSSFIRSLPSVRSGSNARPAFNRINRLCTICSAPFDGAEFGDEDERYDYAWVHHMPRLTTLKFCNLSAQSIARQQALIKKASKLPLTSLDLLGGDDVPDQSSFGDAFPATITKLALRHADVIYWTACRDLWDNLTELTINPVRGSCMAVVPVLPRVRKLTVTLAETLSSEVTPQFWAKFPCLTTLICHFDLREGHAHTELFAALPTTSAGKTLVNIELNGAARRWQFLPLAECPKLQSVACRLEHSQYYFIYDSIAFIPQLTVLVATANELIESGLRRNELDKRIRLRELRLDCRQSNHLEEIASLLFDTVCCDELRSLVLTCHPCEYFPGYGFYHLIENISKRLTRLELDMISLECHKKSHDDHVHFNILLNACTHLTTLGVTMEACVRHPNFVFVSSRATVEHFILLGPWDQTTMHELGCDDIFAKMGPWPAVHTLELRATWYSSKVRYGDTTVFSQVKTYFPNLRRIITTCHIVRPANISDDIAFN